MRSVICSMVSIAQVVVIIIIINKDKMNFVGLGR
jgi:hypothetical protein